MMMMNFTYYYTTSKFEKKNHCLNCMNKQLNFTSTVLPIQNIKHGDYDNYINPVKNVYNTINVYRSCYTDRVAIWFNSEKY